MFSAEFTLFQIVHAFQHRFFVKTSKTRAPTSLMKGGGGTRYNRQRNSKGGQGQKGLKSCVDPPDWIRKGDDRDNGAGLRRVKTLMPTHTTSVVSYHNDACRTTRVLAFTPPTTCCSGGLMLSYYLHISRVLTEQVQRACGSSVLGRPVH